jgi:hypothetical protein
MAVEIISVKSGNDMGYPVIEYQGLAADAKPVPKELGNESTFLELDTGKGFVYSRANTNPTTSNGWWGVV